MTVAEGATATSEFKVSEADTAVALGSGDVPVLGTPRVLAWCEQVTVMALDGLLDDGQTSVGFKIDLKHLAPTSVGAAVTVSATLGEVDGRKLTFSVEVTDGNGTAATGDITRVIVDRQQFIGQAPE